MSGEAYESKDEERRLLERIDAELQAALALEPSPGFLPRMRRRMAEPAPRPRPRTAWLATAAAVTGGFVAGAIFLGRSHAPVPRPVPQAPVAREAPGPSIPPVVSLAEVGPTRGRARPVARVRDRDAEILVPPGQEALLRRYVETMTALAAVPSQQAVAMYDPSRAEIAVDPAVLLGGRDELGDIGVASIEIEPLTLEPMSEE